MQFGEFATYLEKLEGTSSRLTMTEILAELFSRVHGDEARLIAYLSQGKLGPAYKSLDFGIADKMVIRGLAAGFGMEIEDVTAEFKKAGDLGLATESLKRTHGKDVQGHPSISKVYELLSEIAGSVGTGSQEKKQMLVAEMVAALDPLAARYAIRILLGKLRSGFSDMTVLDALSWMKTGNKSLRKELESIYNVRTDLGEVAKLVKEHEDVKKIEVDPVVGVPVLMARAERAASATEIWERCGECAAEYKLDGLRIQAHIKDGEVNLFSRGLENVTSMYPDVVEGLAAQIKKDSIVEGEMIAVGKDGKFLPFQETVQRKRKYDIAEMSSKIPLKIFLFEVLSISGKNVMGETNETRRELLEKLVQTGDTVKLMPRALMDGPEAIEVFFKKSLSEGTEGIVVKKLTGPYQAGSRNFNWIKYKKSYDKSALADTIDAVVMGYDAGQGKRATFGIGDFLIGVRDEKTDTYKTIAKIGTGLTDEEWRRMKAEIDAIAVDTKPEAYEVLKVMDVDVWAKPRIVVEIQADEITKSPMHTAGVALRFPRLVSFREKKPDDATSLKEIERLFGMQKAQKTP